MQRKNYTLKNKPAFALIMAIAVIVIVTTILAVSLRMTAQSTKRTSELYLYEQAEMIAYNAAEYALYRIGNTPCTYTGGNFNVDTIYNVNIATQYISQDSSCANEYYTTGQANDNTAIIDVTVMVDNVLISPERIRYHKRYIQKF